MQKLYTTIKAIAILAILYFLYVFTKKLNRKPNMTIEDIKIEIEADQKNKNRVKDYVSEKALSRLLNKLTSRK